MDIQNEMKEKGYIRYEATIRKNNNLPNAFKIKMIKDIGNIGDVVEVYVKVIRKMVNVEDLPKES